MVSPRVVALLLAIGAVPVAADPPMQATAAWGDQKVAPSSTVLAADVTFRDHVASFATATGRHVAGWGTLLLARDDAGVSHPRRFATLLPDEGGRGAYVVEIGPAVALQVLTFDADGRTQAFASDLDPGHAPRPGDAPLLWTAHPDTALAHTAGHHRGGEDFALSLDHDQLVLDRYHYVDDVRERTKGDVDATYRVAGVCKPRCPAVRTQPYQDSDLAIGPITAFSAPLANVPGTKN